MALSALLVIMVDIHLPYNHCKKSTLRVTIMYHSLWSTGSLRVSPYDRASVVNLMRLDVPFKNPTEKSEWVSHSSYKVFPPYGPPSVHPKSLPLW
ncbi:hypothetical protein PQE63_gp01 [Salmonella phage vB_STy-RN5i1]|uniref:hypothetical protein n=1 Tax=Salmonella phage vB_STy-RN5i1 TaxID=2910951 RepID=UPI00232A799A|nr:hypothetical protein PQE63_gp01 [Salmonella phage vB_STy-RN5i1]UJD21322.1 hypothetical protein RN5i1_gp001 [Salmonella phage vB_STy-RN5i1]